MLLPEMLPSLAISKTEAGVIFTSYFVAYTVLSPVLGLLTDRYDIRMLLTLFSFLLGAGAFLMTYSSSIVTASLFFALAGVGTSACWVPVVTLAQRWAGERRRGMMLAFVDVGSSLGIIVSSAVIPLIVVAYSWRVGWVSLGVLAFSLVVVNFLLVRSYPADKSSLRPTNPGQHTGEPVRVTYRKILRNTRFWLIGLSYMLVGFSILIPFTFLSTYAVQELMMPYEVAVRLITVIGVGAIVGKMVLGPFSDNVGRIRVMMLSTTLIAIGSLGMAYNQLLWALVLFIAIFALGYGAVWSLYAVAARDYFAKEYTGSIIGLWTVCLGVGSILSPIIAGWVADITGTLMWSFVLSAAGGLVASLLLLPVWIAQRPVKPAESGRTSA